MPRRRRQTETAREVVAAADERWKLRRGMRQRLPLRITPALGSWQDARVAVSHQSGEAATGCAGRPSGRRTERMNIPSGLVRRRVALAGSTAIRTGMSAPLASAPFVSE